MSKIVIIAPKDATDVDDAVKVLKAAGHDVDVEEPSAKSLLHMVLGLFGPNAYGFGENYSVGAGAGSSTPDEESKDDKNDSTDDADASDADSGTADPGADFNFESLGTVSIDGEDVEAVRTTLEESRLQVAGLIVGSRTTYCINESVFSFWPASQEQLLQRVDIRAGKHRTSLELVVENAETPRLLVGKDLIGMFEAK